MPEFNLASSRASEGVPEPSDEQLEQQLEALLIANPDFELLENEFQHYCPFEASGIVRAETRHSNFLAYLLDPYRPHALGSRLLKHLVITAIKNMHKHGLDQKQVRPLEVQLMDFEDVEIRREFRNIDLLILSQKHKIVVAIELKIESRQSIDQLERYRRVVQDTWPQGWRHLFIFLTKYDEAPIDKLHWVPVRLRELVPILDKITDLNTIRNEVQISIAAYVRMLRRHHMPNERLETLARKIWSEHAEALNFLINNRPDALGEVFNALVDERDEISVFISCENFQFVCDSHTASLVRFALKKWDLLPGFFTATWSPSGRSLLFEIKREGDKAVAVLYLGPFPREYRSKYEAALRDNRMHRPNTKMGPDWSCLAKEKLYEFKGLDDFDADKARATIRQGFAFFVSRVSYHYDKILTAQALDELEKF